MKSGPFYLRHRGLLASLNTGKTVVRSTGSPVDTLALLTEAGDTLLTELGTILDTET